MARKKSVPNVPPAEAVYVVESMIGDGRINAVTLETYRNRYRDEIQSLESRLARLKNLGGAVAVGAVAAAAVTSVTSQSKKRGASKILRPREVSEDAPGERLKIRQLQARYLQLLRQIPKRVAAKRFGRDAIAKDGKESVIQAMERYVARVK